MRQLLLFLSMALLPSQFCYAADKTRKEEEFAGRSLASWIAQLDSADSLQRMLAINALADIGPKSEPAVHKLLDLAVKDCKGYVSQNAERALVAIGEEAFNAILAKLGTITDDDRPEVYTGMLREFGKAFRSKLLAHLKDENCVVVRGCINALAVEWIDATYKPVTARSSEFVSAMKALLEHKDKSVREAAKSVIDDIEKPRWKCCGSGYR
jgi:hypothetical protein